MWGQSAVFATQPRRFGRCLRPFRPYLLARPEGRCEQRPKCGRLLPPRLEVAHFPAAEAVATGLALHPGFGFFAHITGEEVAALDAIIPVGSGDRRDRAVGAGER